MRQQPHAVQLFLPAVACAEMPYDSNALRQVLGVKLGDERILDETTILQFHHLLETHQMNKKLLVEVNSHLAENGISLFKTLMDANISDAPYLAKNASKARCPGRPPTKVVQHRARGGILRGRKLLGCSSLRPQRVADGIPLITIGTTKRGSHAIQQSSRRLPSEQCPSPSLMLRLLSRQLAP